MSVNDEKLNSRERYEYLQSLSEEVEKSDVTVRSKLTSKIGLSLLWLSNKQDTIPEWAANHIAITYEFEKAIQQLRREGNSEVPEGAARILSKSKESVVKLANKIKPKLFVCLVESLKGPSVDRFGLLQSTSPSDQSILDTTFEWHLNMSLLMDVYNHTENPELKKQISFLVINYLAKAAPINIDDISMEEHTRETMKEMFQVGFFESPMTYHRESNTFEVYLRDKIKEKYHPASGRQFYLTDTSEFGSLLPLKFSVVDEPANFTESSISSWADSIVQEMSRHINSSSQNPLDQFLNTPLLFDLTSFLGDSIQPQGDDEKVQAFEVKLTQFETALNEAVLKAAEQLKKQYPDKISQDEETIAAYLRANINCICRTELEKIGVLKILPVFYNRSFYICSGGILEIANNLAPKYIGLLIFNYRRFRLSQAINAFLNLTGIRLGGVRGRSQLFNLVELSEVIDKANTVLIVSPKRMVSYAPQGENALYFPGKFGVVNTQLFTRFLMKCSLENNLTAHPHLKILGKSTLNLIKGLFDEISNEQWEKLNEDPHTRQLIQTTMYRLMQHLATAENQMEDYTKFTQAIELAHYEIATLLTMTSPFADSDFEEIYKSKLEVIPEPFKQNVKVCVAKSAMNAFSGINIALMNTIPHPQTCYDEGLYFEEALFLGETRSLPAVMQNEEIRKVDLYVGEFNHNINIDLTHTHYMPTNIIEHVEALLREKPETEQLTVAVDCTIDLTNSEKVKEMLNHFSKEIEEGKLNFIIFRSGQKFDMLGMDNYYGAPLYIVNNGSERWKTFEQLFQSETFKTDPLSMQWFCLAHKYASKEMDDYRAQIFQNTRSILNHLPDKLKPGNNPTLQVSTVDVGMDPCFIDIKIIGHLPGRAKEYIESRFYEKFTEKKFKAHSRGSFGFFDSNFNVIITTRGEPRNIRINPGLNPADADIIVELLEELAQECAPQR